METLHSSQVPLSSPSPFNDYIDQLASSNTLTQVSTFVLTWLVVFAGAWVLSRPSRGNESLVLAQNLVSTVHALASAALGASLWLNSSPTCEVAEDGRERLVLALTAGYLTSHAITMTYLHSIGARKVDVATYIHHIFTITWFVLGLSYNKGVWFGAILLFTEASTPFVNMFEYLKERGLKNSPVFAINGLLLTFSFFLCRVVFLPICYLQFEFQQNACVKEYGSVFANVIRVGYLVLAVLNGLWFRRLMLGALSSLKKMGNTNTSFSK